MRVNGVPWFRRGNKAVRVTKILFVSALLYLFAFLFTAKLKIASPISFFLIYVGFFAWMKVQQVKNLRLAGMDEIDKMNVEGTQFEDRVALLFCDLGWRDVHTTKKSGDFGADVVATIPGVHKIVAQCKCYGEGETVGLDAVQQAVAAIRMYKAKSAMVVTNRNLTANAKKLALVNNVVVWEREQLAKYLASVASDRSTMFRDLKFNPSTKFKRELQLIGHQLGRLIKTLVYALRRTIR